MDKLKQLRFSDVMLDVNAMMDYRVAIY